MVSKIVLLIVSTKRWANISSMIGPFPTQNLTSDSTELKSRKESLLVNVTCEACQLLLHSISSSAELTGSCLTAGVLSIQEKNCFRNVY